MTHAIHAAPRRLTENLADRATLVVAAYVLFFFGALPALLWTLGGRLDTLLALPSIGGMIPRVAGSLIAILGTGYMARSMLVLHRLGGGLPISHLPPTRLTARGPYADVRHPIYLGYVAAFCGAGAAAGSLGRAVGAAAILASGSLIYALGFEEPRLGRRFGAAYETYRIATPLFPRLGGGRVRAALEHVWTACRPLVESVANRTVLLRSGPTVWVTYGVTAALAAAIIGVGMTASLAGAGLPTRVTATCLTGLAVSIPLGSRLMWLAYRAGEIRRNPLGTLRQVGFVSWGGFLGMFGFLICFAEFSGLDRLWILDRALLAGFAGQAMARLGCLTYGCCYGKPAALGVRWTDADSKPMRELGGAGVCRRVPTQLLSSAKAAVVFGILLGVASRHPEPGTVTGLGLLLYGMARMGIECLRADLRYGPLGLTQGQIGAAFAIAAGIALLLALPAGLDRHSGTPFAWSAVPGLLPLLIPCVGFVLIVYGMHWKRVGRW